MAANAAGAEGKARRGTPTTRQAKVASTVRAALGRAAAREPLLCVAQCLASRGARPARGPAPTTRGAHGLGSVDRLQRGPNASRCCRRCSSSGRRLLLARGEAARRGARRLLRCGLACGETEERCFPASTARASIGRASAADARPRKVSPQVTQPTASPACNCHALPEAPDAGADAAEQQASSRPAPLPGAPRPPKLGVAQGAVGEAERGQRAELRKQERRARERHVDGSRPRRKAAPSSVWRDAPQRAAVRPARPPKGPAAAEVARSDPDNGDRQKGPG